MKEHSHHRPLTCQEIETLKAQNCYAEDWEQILVSPLFNPTYIRHVLFSGKVYLGLLDKEFILPGGVKKHAGIYKASIHNCEIGDNVLIESVHNYIANYIIEEDVYIENVNRIVTDQVSSFGNGVCVSVLNETGGREVLIYDELSAQTAYMMAMYRHRPELTKALTDMVQTYARSVSCSMGRIGKGSKILNSGTLQNVKVGEFAVIEGASHLKNGSINSTIQAPVFIGDNVIADDFIISSGAHVDSGAGLTHCFVGQACHLASKFSAHDSLFFSNCQMENGEACAIFAGPYTVTMHKSSLLIAGMFSFCNAGSGSNQSNHMYKLGPIHQGVVERGAKTTSDSYILWPAKVGAFSLVMGRHVHHSDTSAFPFSYLIEQGNDSYIIPGVNLRSVGTVRDAQKWPKRDKRQGDHHLDQINFNLLSPYMIQKMVKGTEILKELVAISGKTSQIYVYQSCKIKRSSLVNGLKLYQTGIVKFLGNSLISRVMGKEFDTLAGLRNILEPDHTYGKGKWLDLSGLIVPKKLVKDLVLKIEGGEIQDLSQLNQHFALWHQAYYDMEWTWAADLLCDWFDIDFATVTAEDLTKIIQQWKEAVVSLDEMLYQDAQKEFSLDSMIGFGIDGDDRQQAKDFALVRGDFESNAFVTSVKEHIIIKSALAEQAIRKIETIQ